MKKLILPFLLLMAGVINAQTGNIRFTIKRSTTQANQIMIYGKNITGSTISGILGASNLTLCIGFPKIYYGNPTISSPISGQTFFSALPSAFGNDSTYAWNGNGSTAVVDFAPNVEVVLAAITFNGTPSALATVKIMNLPGSGPTGFDYNYIAPNGGEQSGYSTPFYSNITNDPLLINANNPINDIFSTIFTSSMGVGSVILPTKFLSFYATKSDDVAKLTWTVDNEENNNYFEVEGSTDGRNFTMLQKVNSLHNGRTSNTYNTVDNTISRYNAKVLYYRIKQVEADGRVIYSEIRQISLTGKDFSAALYPNPVKTNTNLVIDAPVAMKAIVIIRDAAGKSVKQMTIELVKGINQQPIDAASFAAGDYNVTIISDKLNQTIKMTKSN